MVELEEVDVFGGSKHLTFSGGSVRELVDAFALWCQNVELLDIFSLQTSATWDRKGETQLEHFLDASVRVRKP